MTASVLIVNGPNLNLLGERQPELYGATTLQQIEQRATEQGKALGLQVECVQSNHEGALIERIHTARTTHGIIINAGGLTHTSIALMDALLACEKPVIEVHITNIHRREAFRHTSYVAQAARATLAGFGPEGYIMAMTTMAAWLKHP